MSSIEQSSFSLESDGLAEGEGTLSETVVKPRKRGRPRKILQEAVVKPIGEENREIKAQVESKAKGIPTSVKHSTFTSEPESREKKFQEPEKVVAGGEAYSLAPISSAEGDQAPSELSHATRFIQDDKGGHTFKKFKHKFGHKHQHHKSNHSYTGGSQEEGGNRHPDGNFRNDKNGDQRRKHLEGSGSNKPFFNSKKTNSYVPGAGKRHHHANPNQHRQKQDNKYETQSAHNNHKLKRPGDYKQRPLPKSDDSELNWRSLVNWETLNNLELLAGFYQQHQSQSVGQEHFNELYKLSFNDLMNKARMLEIQLPSAVVNRKIVLSKILTHYTQTHTTIIVSGILEQLDSEGGCLVYEEDNYHINSLSAYVPSKLIQKYGLKRGQKVKAWMTTQEEQKSAFFVFHVETVMGQNPELNSTIVPFTELIPYYPLDRVMLECINFEGSSHNYSMRVLDLLTPIGLGQRGLIVAPPRTGKTVLLQEIAKSIRISRPEVHLIVLLIDERPEEVTDFKRILDCEIVSSNFDEPAENHVHVAEMVIEKARCMVECGEHVVILLDSITRLARAYNALMPSSGKILSGGVEANALRQPKRFFGSARNIEGGGSLTILASALVETGSRMDDVIFEEFKGAGNMEIYLERALSEKRIFPALNIERGSTRKEELLYHKDEIQKIYALRRAMKGMPPTDAMDMLLQKLKRTKTNTEFLIGL